MSELRTRDAPGPSREPPGLAVSVFTALAALLAALLAPFTAMASDPAHAPPRTPDDVLQAHLVPWHLGALIVGFVCAAGLMRRFAPARRRRLRPTALMFCAYLVTLAFGAGFEWAHWTVRAEEMWFAADLLETFITLNLVTLIFFDLVLKMVRVVPPTIVSDVVIGVSYLVAVLHALHQAHVNFTGLVTTSAVATGVVSLSLAPTIGNILGGFALQLDSSIQEGDWIQLDANTQGLVKAIRWRHTVVETRNWDTIIVPNATLLAANITILGKRAEQPVQRRYWIYFNVDFRYHPSDVIAVVNEGLQHSPMPNVATEPKPHCICMDFARDGRDSMGYYAARYWLTNLAADDPTNSVVRERLYSALKRAGIPLAVPATTVFVSRDDDEHHAAKAQRERTRRIELLSRLEMFRAFKPEEIAQLADALVYASFARDEVMTQQGHEAHWLYILAHGKADVILTDPSGESTKVQTLRAPDFFGEMGVMTGAPRAATVAAACACDCYRLDKDAFRKILLERPELAAQVSAILVHRREELRLAQEQLDPEGKHQRLEAARDKLLGQIQSFFGLR